MANALTQVWERCIRDDPADNAVEVDVPAFPTQDATLEWVSSDITQKAIAVRVGELWMIHAAGIANPKTGATVALVGPSGAGKTTAARTLAREFGYVSDETVGIAIDGTVAPYPKPLSIVQPGNDHKRQVSPTELGLLHAPGDCRLAGIVLLNRTENVPTEVRTLPTGEALVRLAEQTSYIALMERPLLTMAGHLERIGGAVEITYSDASELIPAVRAIVGG